MEFKVGDRVKTLNFTQLNKISTLESRGIFSTPYLIIDKCKYTSETVRAVSDKVCKVTKIGKDYYILEFKSGLSTKTLKVSAGFINNMLMSVVKCEVTDQERQAVLTARSAKVIEDRKKYNARVTKEGRLKK